MPNEYRSVNLSALITPRLAGEATAGANGTFATEWIDLRSHAAPGFAVLLVLAAPAPDSTFWIESDVEDGDGSDAQRVHESGGAARGVTLGDADRVVWIEVAAGDPRRPRMRLAGNVSGPVDLSAPVYFVGPPIARPIPQAPGVAHELIVAPFVD